MMWHEAPNHTATPLRPVVFYPSALGTPFRYNLDCHSVKKMGHVELSSLGSKVQTLQFNTRFLNFVHPRKAGIASVCGMPLSQLLLLATGVPSCCQGFRAAIDCRAICEFAPSGRGFRFIRVCSRQYLRVYRVFRARSASLVFIESVPGNT